MSDHDDAPRARPVRKQFGAKLTDYVDDPDELPFRQRCDIEKVIERARLAEDVTDPVDPDVVLGLIYGAGSLRRRCEWPDGCRDGGLRALACRSCEKADFVAGFANWLARGAPGACRACGEELPYDRHLERQRWCSDACRQYDGLRWTPTSLLPLHLVGDDVVSGWADHLGGFKRCEHCRDRLPQAGQTGPRRSTRRFCDNLCRAAHHRTNAMDRIAA